MHHVRDVMLLHHAPNGWFVAQIATLEDVFGVGFQAGQVFQVTGIREAIEVDQDADLLMIYNVPDQIGPDKTGAASDEEIHSMVG